MERELYLDVAAPSRNDTQWVPVRVPEAPLIHVQPRPLDRPLVRIRPLIGISLAALAAVAGVFLSQRARHGQRRTTLQREACEPGGEGRVIVGMVLHAFPTHRVVTYWYRVFVEKG